MPVTSKIVPCLWFDDQAEEAANFYLGIFPNSRILGISRYGEAGVEFHGKPVGSVLTVTFELDGQSFTALNGGPMFQFNEAISLQVMCETQEEIDHYWERLGDGGTIQQCGWLKDRFGLSWQVAPTAVAELLQDPATAEKAMGAIFQMQKIDLAEILRVAAA
ncbi:MAG: 3-demethylubiquinone-9 3-methyltransferase [Armatimonadetes bacterium]|jgi:predicted 3-demethylubiquinone-9 3-methyltransferase (glyoxalase superfamily)|nr:3-demethylubiquinone-9 3-methyltransferase [Armatimonadota bacterium]